MTDPLEALSDRVTRCLNNLHRLLIPPFTTFPAKDFVSTLQSEICADAVAIFLRSREDPSILSLAEGVGYRDEYRETEYHVNGEFLTSKLYVQKRALNASVQGLRDGKYGPLPVSKRCELFIETERFHNIIAVPIALPDEEWPYGILKIENKKDPATNQVFSDVQEFPPEDFALARILALAIAVAYQQRRFAELWSAAEVARHKHRLPQHFLESISTLLATWLHAETAGVFLRTTESRLGLTESERDVFKFAGGYGCQATAIKQTFPVGGDSFTAYLGRIQTPVRLSSKDCKRYSDLSATSPGGKGVRGVLGIPLMSKAHCFGVLRVENKLTTDGQFDRHDQHLAKAFADQQIVPALLSLAAKPASAETEGFRSLLSLGQSEKLEGMSRLHRVKEVEQVRKRSDGAVTIADCCDYLQISEPFYFKLRKQAATLRRGLGRP